MTTISSSPPEVVRTLAKPPAAAPSQAPTTAAAPSQAATAAKGDAIFKSGTEMVEFGEKFIESLSSKLGAVKAFKAMLSPEHIEKIRNARGDEIAESLRATYIEGIGKCERMAQADQAALRSVFSVSGDLATKDDKGDNVLGKFTLKGRGGGFAVIIDSEKGAFVSNNGKEFTSNFARIVPPQNRNLPYLKLISDTLNIKV
jgi:hypothetical protein